MPDISVAPGAWQNIYEKSGISAGAALIIQNKSPLSVTIQESATAPGSRDNQGWQLASGAAVSIDAGSPGAWVLSSLSPAQLFVQEG